MAYILVPCQVIDDGEGTDFQGIIVRTSEDVGLRVPKPHVVHDPEEMPAEEKPIEGMVRATVVDRSEHTLFVEVRGLGKKVVCVVDELTYIDPLAYELLQDVVGWD